MILYPHVRQDLNEIKRIVAEAYGVTVSQMVAPGRDPDFVVPRMVAMVLAMHAGYSTPKVAVAFGRSDHTNSIYARRRVHAWMGMNPDFAETVNALSAKCGLSPIDVPPVKVVGF